MIHSLFPIAQDYVTIIQHIISFYIKLHYTSSLKFSCKCLFFLAIHTSKLIVPSPLCLCSCERVGVGKSLNLKVFLASCFACIQSFKMISFNYSTHSKFPNMLFCTISFFQVEKKTISSSFHHAYAKVRGISLIHV